ncbi:RNase HII [Thermosyntropha lipolytica DSM 11003]|uniref:Ribonuclease HII n=1 Tax=Thermosyntropha lipolytica DSM 11003 TaxID=1123382 RepID=A0A1M5QN96_9FIRM|nr:ribonuclease HII [Thermosyntropha lipolytica]SHH15408.1 RNase HII [Thermosyntropha lipolytica DSM 11003]
MRLDMEAEKIRIKALSEYEEEAYGRGIKYIAGVDEVGRGTIAGPVVAGAVILPAGFFLPGVNDSKKLSAKKRAELAEEIKKRALSWAVSYVWPAVIDEINILNATRLAMQLAVKNLHLTPDLILTDAVKIPDINIEQINITRGDQLSISIACASIIAKVERDNTMQNLDILCPGYGMADHKGYATRRHVEELFKRGCSFWHRKSFEPVKSIVYGGWDVQPCLFE